MAATLKEALAGAGYTNAGTVEFLMDEGGQLYFMEVNARIQVEHPVTEFVTGIDLVKSQIRIAMGEPLDEVIALPVELRGHAIECRINAENPVTFTPSPGRITGFHVPGGIGVRVDTMAHTDCVITPYYDSLVAKLIVHGGDRAEAIHRMQRALEMFVVEGIHTSIPLHQRILADADFQAGGSIRTSSSGSCRRSAARTKAGRGRAQCACAPPRTGSRSSTASSMACARSWSACWPPLRKFAPSSPA
jgi:acetyl-CoA carboxylase biotin carboxylase subunit